MIYVQKDMTNWYEIKEAFPFIRHFLATESPSKTMKNAF